MGNANASAYNEAKIITISVVGARRMVERGLREVVF